MYRLTKFLFVVAGVLALSTIQPSQAAPVTALQSFTGGVNATSGSDQLYGWIFDVLSPITVSSLGVGDTGGDGLVIPHDVGIFRVSDQALMVSATVPDGTGATLDNGFRYVSAPLTVLNPGQYVIVMTMPVFNGDTQAILVDGASIVTASEIAYVNSAFDGSTNLAFPNSAFNGAFAPGMFGPNFQFNAEVPEPMSMVVFGTLAVGGVVALRRRRA